MKIAPELTFFVTAVIVFSGGPGYADSLYQRCKKGVQHYEEGNYEKALNKFIDAQIEAPDNPHLIYNSAAAHYKMRNFEEAAKSYLSVAAATPDQTLEEHSYYNLGNCMYRQGKLLEAVEYYKQALELDPDDEDAKHNLEFVREEIKRRLNREKQRQEQQSSRCERPEQPRQDQEGRPPKEEQQQAQQRDQKQSQQDNQTKQNDEQQTVDRHPSEDQEDRRAENPDQSQTAERRPMTEEEAERWLKSLSENQKEALKKQVRRQYGDTRSPEKDW